MDDGNFRRRATSTPRDALVGSVPMGEHAFNEIRSLSQAPNLFGVSDGRKVSFIRQPYNERSSIMLSLAGRSQFIEHTVRIELALRR